MKGLAVGTAASARYVWFVSHRCDFPSVSICYGMTETSPVSTQTRRDDSLAAAGGQGFPAEGAHSDHQPACTPGYEGA
jgi:acyl-CoA synthetase (AMP-forming)/AMP-acid ligase II